jgi:hypothetical protein
VEGVLKHFGLSPFQQRRAAAAQKGRSKHDLPGNVDEAVTTAWAVTKPKDALPYSDLFYVQAGQLSVAVIGTKHLPNRGSRPATDQGVPHISPVFGEMWETQTLI